MKRMHGGSATGGTGDVKPQILTVTNDVALTDDYAVTQINLPVPRIGLSRGKSVITEILWVDYYFSLAGLADTSSHHWGFLTPQTARTDAETSDVASLVVDAANQNNFALVIDSNFITTSGVTFHHFPDRYDMTDGNGNGFLYAGDKMFLVTGNISGAGQCVAKICYRMVGVTLEEYVGIVQSQQSG